MRLPAGRSGSDGLIVKVTEPDVGADRFNGYEIALDPGSQCLRVGRHRQNFELIKDLPCPVPVDRWLGLVVRMSGD